MSFKLLIGVGLIFLIVVSAYLFLFSSSTLKIKEVIPEELLVESNSRTFIVIEAANRGLGFYKVNSLKVDSAPIELFPINSYRFLPLQTKEMLVKVVVPANVSNNIYNVNIIINDKISFPYRIIVGDKSNLLNYRYQKLKDSLDYVKMLNLGIDEKTANELENKLEKAKEMITKNDFGGAESVLDDIEITLYGLEGEKSEQEFFIFKIWFVIPIFIVLILLYLFRSKLKFSAPRISIPKVRIPKPSTTLSKPKIQMQQSQTFTQQPQLVQRSEITSKVPSSLRSEMLRLIEEQYRAGLLSERTYQELKRKYGRM